MTVKQSLVNLLPAAGHSSIRGISFISNFAKQVFGFKYTRFLCTQGNECVASAARDQQLLEPGLQLQFPASSNVIKCIFSRHV
jgi:hypothetical protein